MKRWNPFQPKIRIIGASLLTVVLLAGVVGCGEQTYNNTNKKSNSNTVEFQNRTNELLVNPDSQLDPTRPNGVDYTHIQATDSTGKTTVLDARKTPILVVAYWCPHCQRTLQLLSKYRTQFATVPIVLNVGYSGAAKLSDATRIQQQEEKALGLQPFLTDYALNSTAGDKYAPKGYPTLIYQGPNGLETLYGEHTLDVWKQVLTGGARQS